MSSPLASRYTIRGTRRDVRVCRAGGANARGVAELAMGLILALARSLPFSDQGLKRDG